MSDYVKELLKTIPENDQYYTLKCAEIRRWGKVYGKEILNPRDMESILGVLPNLLKNNLFWNSDIRLDNFSLGEALLDGLDISNQEDGMFVFNLYKFACLLCSERCIKSIFHRLDKDKDWSVEEYVPDILSRYGPLMRFWSHYINVIGVENPHPAISASFKKLLSGYEKGFSSDNINDIWEYGFECAKREGGREALEFFWKKIENQYRVKEKEKVLVDIGLHVDSLCREEDSYFNIVEFCLKHLGTEKNKDFVKEYLKMDKNFSMLSVLIDSYLYEEAKKLITILGPGNISYQQYRNPLICNVLAGIHKIPCKLRKSGIDFFIWLWDSKEFEKHKQYTLDNISYIFDALRESTKLGMLEPLKLILQSMSPKQIEEACYSPYLRRVCSALYTRNERDLLQQSIFNFVKDGDKFISHLDDAVLNRLNEREELKNANVNNTIFSLYINGNEEEFIKSIQHLIDDPKDLLYELGEIVLYSLRDMIEGKTEFDKAVPSILSNVGDTESTALFNTALSK
ncbi:MAG: hypothetical protein QWI36_04945 [Wolbachia endosymbiont of Tyrophagus putrescentiae]|nr:hypothetical protein [Wolbachia endosymbiont of Tyrophagus putrescentiae]